MYLKNGRRSDLGRKGKKQALKAIPWDSDSKSEVDSANMCFMVPGDDLLEVNSESNLEEHEQVSYDDLALYCEELIEKYI